MHESDLLCRAKMAKYLRWLFFIQRCENVVDADDATVAIFLLLAKKSGIAPAFMSPTSLYSYRLTLQSSLDAIQSRAGLPSGSI
jgi:hypothetical protein